MEFNLPAKSDSQEVRIGTGQVLRAITLSTVAAAVTVALCIGAFRLGFETSRANIYQQQNADLKALVGIVDQAKAREVASCAETGRSDCMSVIAPVVTP